jgi:hypothetical protein
VTYQSLNTGIKVDKILGNIYGEIHVHDNATSQSIVNGVTYQKLNVWSDNGLSKLTTPDYLNSEITISETGEYKLEVSLSFSSGTGNIVTLCSIFINGVEQDQAHFTRKVSVANDIGSASITAIANVTAGDKVDVRMKHNNASPVDITIVYGNLNVELVSL